METVVVGDEQKVGLKDPLTEPDELRDAESVVEKLLHAQDDGVNVEEREGDTVRELLDEVVGVEDCERLPEEHLDADTDPVEDAVTQRVPVAQAVKLTEGLRHDESEREGDQLPVTV
jgi:hypothetical protein